MKNKKPTYEELEAKLKETEALLNAIKSGKVDVLLGEQEPLVIQLKSAIEEKERLGLEIKLLLKQWEKTFHTINSCIWILDKEQRVIQSNNFVIEGLECTESDVIGKNCFKLVHKTSSSIPECPLIRAKQSLKRESMEMQENGKWFEITVDPILDENGKYNGAVHILTDISGRKKMESDLQESRVMYQAIFEATGTATIVVDEDNTIIAANNQCLLDTGYSSEELVGTKWTNYVAPESLELMLKYHKLRREDPEKAPKKYEVRLVNKKKEIRDVMLDVGIIPGTKQSVVSMLDITDLKQAENTLKESEERNRIIADMISDYAYIFDISPEGELKDKWLTESFTKVFGYTIEEIDALGGWKSLVFPEDLPIALAHAQKVASGEPDICEMRWVTASGEIRWLRDYAKPIFDKTCKRVIRIYGASQDITERKRADEKTLEQLDELKRWQNVILGREERIIELKKEVNELLELLGKEKKYHLDTKNT